MTLDPQVRAFLDQAAAAGRPALQQQTPAEARAGMEAMRAVLPPGQPVASVANYAANSGDSRINVRIYRPEGAGPLPVLVYYHGGGWVIGSLETHDGVCRALANAAGHLVVSVDYRLAPEHPFPTPAEDAYAALLWAVEQVGSYDGDPERLAVGGDSAGANLAAVVALMARDRSGPALRAQVLVYPVTDADFSTGSYEANAEGYLLTREGMRWFWDHYVPDEAARSDPYASPLRAPDLHGLPPAFVLTAEYDPLRDEGDAYAARLQEADVPVTHRRYAGMIHGFFAWPGIFTATDRAVAEVAAFLKVLPVQATAQR